MPARSPANTAVIDTQVIMDWLVFGDAAVKPIATEIQGRRLTWVGTPAMRAELLHVLQRGVAASWSPDIAAVERAFDTWCMPILEAPPPAVRLVCRDPDDQMFIDLAVAQQCTWLISRDKALLALAKRARQFGVSVLTPQAWLRSQLRNEPA